MLIKTSGITDVGLKREGNEDSYSIDDSLCLYIVADGMGGHLAGEVASKVAVEMIHKSFKKWVEKETPDDELFGYPDSSLSRLGNYLLSSIRLANRIIYELALEYEQYHGMGTTIAILFVTPALIITANVGDSRIYIIRNGRIEPLSKDHTIVREQVEIGAMTEEEAAASPLRHILTKNLGSAKIVEPEICEIEPSNNDRYILCSDGLTDLVTDEEILEMTNNVEDHADLCRKLVDLALDRGGHDNTTVITVRLQDLEERKKGFLREIGVLLSGFLSGMQKMAKKFHL